MFFLFVGLSWDLGLEILQHGSMPQSRRRRVQTDYYEEMGLEEGTDGTDGTDASLFDLEVETCWVSKTWNVDINAIAESILISSFPTNRKSCKSTSDQRT